MLCYDFVYAAHRFVRSQPGANVDAVCSFIREASSVPARKHHHSLWKPAQNFEQAGNAQEHDTVAAR